MLYDESRHSLQDRLLEFSQLTPLTMGHQANTAVRHVADPPGYLKALRYFRNRHPKANPLDPPLEPGVQLLRVGVGFLHRLALSWGGDFWAI